jgi:hypothetical protein
VGQLPAGKKVRTQTESTCEDTVRAVVSCRVYELAIALYLFVVMELEAVTR